MFLENNDDHFSLHFMHHSTADESHISLTILDLRQRTSSMTQITHMKHPTKTETY